MNLAKVMKANGAPDRIYLFKNPITETPDDRWLSKRSDKNDIEYIRTDAFIEKACKWLRNSGIIRDNSGGYDREFIINKFRKAIEE